MVPKSDYITSPRGSCNTIFETIESSIPVLMINSSHNRESSALPYLSSAFGLSDEKDLNTLGIFTSETDRVKYCLECISSKKLSRELAINQKQVLDTLKGHKELFAKDYLNYFLELSLRINKAK